ncbi:MAG: oligosaccharide flippase family protein [Trueperaceae bacterium]
MPNPADGPLATDEAVTSAPAPAGRPPSGLKRSLVYFATIAAGQGLAFLLLPAVSRALSPEAYGAYSLSLAVSTLIGMVASSWVRNVALRLYFDAATRGTTRGFFLGTALLQALSFSVLYALTLIALGRLDYDLAPLRVMLSAGFAILAGDLAIHATTLLRAEQRTMSFAIAEIGGGVLRFVLTLGGLALGWRSAELLFDASVAGYLLAAAYAVPTLWRRLSGPVGIDVAGTLEVLRHGPSALPFSLGNWLERLADRLVLDYYLGTAVQGIYSIGYTLGERTMGTLINAVFMMAWPEILSAFKEGGSARARAALSEALVLYAWFSLGPVVFLVAYGADLHRWMIGAAFHDGASLVGIVAASMWLGGFTSYLNRHLELGKRFSTLSAITLAGATVNVALNLWLVPRYGMLGAAWATAANRVFNAVVFFAIRDRALVAIPLGTMGAAATVALTVWWVSARLPVAPTYQMLAYVAMYAPLALFLLVRRRRTTRA